MENSEIDFEEVEVQEWVCKKQKPMDQPAPAPSPAEESMNVDAGVPQVAQPTPIADSSATLAEVPKPTLAEVTPILPEVPEKKQFSLVKIVHTKLFCPTHNIVSLGLHMNLQLRYSPTISQSRPCKRQSVKLPKHYSGRRF